MFHSLYSTLLVFAFLPQPQTTDVGGNEELYLVETVRAHEKRISSIVQSSSRKNTFAVASFDGTVSVWDLPSMKSTLRFEAHEGGVYGLDFSPDGKTLATCGADGFVSLWRSRDNKKLQTFDLRNFGVRYVGFVDERHVVASFVTRRHACLLDVVSGRERRIEPVAWLDSPVSAAVLAPNGKSVVLGGKLGRIAVIDSRSLQSQYHTSTVRPGEVSGWEAVQALAVSPNGSMIVAATHFKSASRLGIWGQEKKQLTEVLPTLKERARQGTIWSIAFSPDSKRLIFGGRRLTFWDVESAQTVMSWHPGDARGATANFTAIEHLSHRPIVVTGAFDGTIRLFRYKTRQLEN